MNEINFRTADFDDIDKFVQNLLSIREIDHPGEYESQIAYFTTAAHGLFARRLHDGAIKLGQEIDAARINLAGGLEKLTRTITDASAVSDSAATAATTQARRMVYATWGLVVVTFALALATAGLVWFTRQLAIDARAAPAPQSYSRENTE